MMFDTTWDSAISKSVKMYLQILWYIIALALAAVILALLLVILYALIFPDNETIGTFRDVIEGLS